MIRTALTELLGIRHPIIQGGMAVRVSLHNLAGAVAKEGAVGIIAVSGMNSADEVKSEIRKARKIAGEKAIIGINIMGVIGRFVELTRAAMEEKIDLVIQGAGFREDIFGMGREYNVPIFSMASSVRVAKKGEDIREVREATTRFVAMGVPYRDRVPRTRCSHSFSTEAQIYRKWCRTSQGCRARCSY